MTFFYRGNAAAADEVRRRRPRRRAARSPPQQVDVRDSEACAAAVERVAERCGRIDILVNNAGIDPRQSARRVRRRRRRGRARHQRHRRVQRDARGGAVHDLAARRAGSSTSARSPATRAAAGQTNYAASKGAINAFTRALAVELAPRKITVNCVAPGVIETEMSQDVREMAGDEVKARILLQALRHGRRRSRTPCGFSPRRTRTTSPARCSRVDGGFKME